MENIEKNWTMEIVKKYESALISYAYGFMEDIEKARDIVQDTFLRLCKQERSKIESYIAPWLYKVCRNRALEILRKEHRMTFFKEGQLENVKSNEPDPSSQSLWKDDTENVFRLLETLPKNQQEVIRLKFQHDMTYREISEITQLSVSNVGFLIHTAIKALRKKMDKKQNIKLQMKGGSNEN